RQYVTTEEARIFEDFFCGTALTDMHRAVDESGRLIRNMNEVLARTPLAGEVYKLEWRAAPDSAGRVPLARHQDLLRRDPDQLTEDQRLALFEAVKATVQEARRLASEEGADFTVELERLFD